MTALSVNPDDLLREARQQVSEDEQLAQATHELLDGVVEFIRRYVVLPSDEAATAIALFVLHTWVLEAAEATPYLVVVSEEKRSGKTRLLEVLELLVRAPWRTASTTEAAVFRKIEAEQPTLLLDEIDAIFGGSRTEPLRGVLNAGNRRGSTITRAEGKGTRDFSPFCAKVLAGINTGSLPDTITDRSIVILMQRRENEPVERMRARPAKHAAGPIAWSLERWATAVTDKLKGAEPVLPDEISDRAADAWEPLLAIADHAGEQWSTRARTAAIALNMPTDPKEHMPTEGLLASIRGALGEKT